MNLEYTNKKYAHHTIIFLFALSCIAFVIGKNLAINNLTPSFGIVFILISLTVFRRPKIGISIFLIITYFLSFFVESYPVLPRKILWINDIILLSLLLRTTIIILRKEYQIKGNLSKTLHIWMLVLIGWMFLSAIINLVQPMVAIQGFRVYFYPIALFVSILINRIETKFIIRWLKILIVYIILMVPISLILRLFFHFERDAGNGLMSSSVVAILIVPLIFGLIYYGTSKKESKYYIFASSLILLPIAGEALAFFYFLPVTALFLLISKPEMKNRLSLIICCIGLILLGNFVLQNYFPKFVIAEQIKTNYQRPEYAIEYLLMPPKGSDVRLGRLSSVFEAISTIREHGLNFIIGFGPGSNTDNIFDDLSNRKITSMYLFKNQVSITLVELGSVGFLLYIFLFLYVVSQTRKMSRQCDDLLIKAVAFAQEGFCWIMLLGVIYFRLWDRGPVGTSFWLIMALLCQYNEKKRINNKNGVAC